MPKGQGRLSPQRLREWARVRAEQAVANACTACEVTEDRPRSTQRARSSLRVPL